MTRPEDLPAAFEVAWNAHDMEALGGLFEADATFVNRFATFRRGLEEIVELHRTIHETVYRGSVMANDLHAVDLIAPGVAVVHFWSHLTTSQAHPAGVHAVETLLMAVLVERDGAWRIKAAENVTFTDPRSGKLLLRGA